MFHLSGPYAGGVVSEWDSCHSVGSGQNNWLNWNVIMRYAATKHLFSYWRRLRGGKPAPERVALNPADIGRFLGDLMLLEKGEGRDYRFRIAGSRLCSLYGSELRGRTITDILLPQSDADVAEMISAVTEDCLPVIAGVSVLLTDGASIDAEMILLPLSHEGRTDGRILGALTFRTQERLAQGACAGIDVLSFRVVHDGDQHGLHPVEPVLPLGAGVAERRGHLTVLLGGLHQA